MSTHALKRATYDEIYKALGWVGICELVNHAANKTGTICGNFERLKQFVFNPITTHSCIHKMRIDVDQDQRFHVQNRVLNGNIEYKVPNSSYTIIQTFADVNTMVKEFRAAGVKDEEIECVKQLLELYVCKTSLSVKLYKQT